MNQMGGKGAGICTSTPVSRPHSDQLADLGCSLGSVRLYQNVETGRNDQFPNAKGPNGAGNGL